MTTELATVYDPESVEQAVYAKWIEAGSFNVEADDPRATYCIVIPPPNVTAPLHLGHALNNTLQDILIRWRRMSRFATLWMPGTDHAGIATQTVVEKRILVEENKRRTDFAREAFVARVQAWKDEYEARIIDQLRAMGCSCDWRRTRFTMDDTCARAVREAFFKLFADGLIYRGKRLVNWDPATQTVLADDEVEHETVHGHFWYMRYPLVEPVDLARGTGVSPVRPTDVPSVESVAFHKRHGAYLPHWTRAGATYALNFRLADAMPQKVLNAWLAERQEILHRAESQGRELTKHECRELVRLFSQRVDAYLDAGHGECWLREERIAGLLRDAMTHFDGDRYELIAWCVMPNHVHAVVRPLGEHKLAKILHSWKSFTAKQANEALGRTGEFWEPEYYDHLIRDEEDFANQVSYLLSNPAKAGLGDWPWVELRKRPEHGQDARATVITHVTVATTRPETMLGDTAVATNPKDPRAAALVGKLVRLPIVGRVIPIVADDHVVLPDPDSDDEKARFSTGFLKVTPAHDPDDYQIGERHLDEIAATRAAAGCEGDPKRLAFVNVMAPDGSISAEHGWDDARGSEAEFLLGMDRFEAREAVVEWFRQHGLLEDVRDYTHEVGHSYRSHVPIEPYLSDQWYVAVKQQVPSLPDEGAIEGTDIPVHSLAGLALKPLLDGRLKFTPERYANTYRNWLEGLRDWPISRQLWWGHQFPIWSRELELPADVAPEPTDRGPDAQVCAALDRAVGGAWVEVIQAGRHVLRVEPHPEKDGWVCTYVCTGPGSAEAEARLEAAGWRRDEDVLDTWFSSALWPFSTLGWPAETPELAKFYPGDVLCTAREIITLWVTRMVMMGQYCRGDIPFTEEFIHAMIQDGQGQKMSKSLGNGVDPNDIIHSHGADAMRFTLTSMTTQTQDVRMPVDLVCPHTGETFPPKLVTNKAGFRVAAPVQTSPAGGGKMVSTYGLASGEAAPTDEIPLARNTSSKFDIGRNFCNKLWNASRFAMMNLAGAPAWADTRPGAHLADAWILSRLNTTVRDVTAAMKGFRFNELADTLYHFLWDDLCDWYLEIAKARIQAGEQAPKAVLAHALDVFLRLLHPVAPFITEAIWQRLNDVAPVRGPGDAPAEPLLVAAQWPQADGSAIRPAAEEAFELLQDLVRQVRNVRTEHNVPPRKAVDALVEATGPAATLIGENLDLLRSQAALGELTVRHEPAPPPTGAAAVTAGGAKLYVLDIIDVDAEKLRLAKQAETLGKGIEGIQRKLANENFVTRAPAEVVQRERDRLADLQAELAVVEESRKALG